MIVIDGRESALNLANFANLEEVLTTLVVEENLEERVVTDVFVNDEAFSELYPHQAEDISVKEISRLEVRSISMDQMATEVVMELPKVVDIMAHGSRKVANLLRQSDLAEALEVMQDVIYVSRDFLNTIQALRLQYNGDALKAEMEKLSDVLGDLLGEVCDVMADEDWILVADLLEYEYLPACEGWRPVIAEISAAIEKAKAA